MGWRVARKRPPVPLTALQDATITNRDWRMFLAVSFLRDPKSETCSADLDDICRITGLPKTRVSESGTKLAALGYLAKRREGRTVTFTIQWDIVPGSGEQSSPESFRVAGNDSAADRSGQRGMVPGSGEQSPADSSGKRGTITHGQFRAAGNNDTSYDIQIIKSDLIGSVETNEKLADETQAAAILRHYGIPEHFIRKDFELIKSWAAEGRTVSQLHRACGRAKTHNPSPGPRYIGPCLQTIATEDAGTATAGQQGWYESSKGISAKGKAYGIDEDAFDAFPQFRHAVITEAIRRNEPGIHDFVAKERRA